MIVSSGTKRLIAEEREGEDAMTNDRDNGNATSGEGPPRRGFGVEGALAHDIVRELAPAAERAGYGAFWVNDEADGDGLASLREAAAVTTSIRLAVGVIPLDRQGPEQIADRIDDLGLPVARLVVGVGSGHETGGLERVRAGVAALRELTDASIVVGAIGPRMCRLAGEIADGVLLDWPPPAYIARTASIVAEAGVAANRSRPWIAGYIFTALGDQGIARLHGQAAYYAAIPSYAAHFARAETSPLDAAAFGADPSALQRALEPFDAELDETVVRAVVAEETAADYLALLAAAAPIAL
jgi:alkanesulfonate monooxygenase SsuD/methylene tetrahydromethanopterin reductase-like flavin-dependent oxidoreductase (luciferase family)